MHISGIFNALAHHASSFDLAQDRADHASTFTGCLLALSRMNMEDSEAPTALIQNHRLIPKTLEALRSDNPAWVIASARLLYAMTRSGSLGPSILQSLHQDPGDPPPSSKKDGKKPGLSKVAVMLIGLSSGLVEGGAVGGSTDALVSGSRLMSLVLEAPTLDQRRQVFKALEVKDAPSMLVKVISVHKGRNESAEVLGAVAEVLDLMILASLSRPSPSPSPPAREPPNDADEAMGDDPQEEEEASITSSVFKLLGESGAIRDLIQELRPQPRPDSASVVLRLLSRVSFTPAGSEQLMSGGILSMCAQIYFNLSAEMMWRLSCMDMICDLAQAPRHRVNLTDTPHKEGGNGGLGEAAARRRILQIIDSNQAQLHVIRALLRMIEISNKAIPPGLHISPLQALVDVADQLQVARVIASSGVIEAAVDLISRDLAADGLYSKEWAIQTQRSAVTLIAVISTHRSLRPIVVETDAIEALCHLMKENVQDGAGIRQQIRVTAAAALYPILGEGADKLLVRRAAGALDALVPMLRSTHEAEVKVARKVLEVMLNDEALSRMFRDAGVDLSKHVAKTQQDEDEYDE